MKNLIDEQISNCRTLLKVFQEERQVYAEKTSVEMSDILASMKQKQQMVEVLASQQALTQSPPQDETDRRRLRELAQLLEQLLVIEQENEIMLTSLLRKGGQEEKRPSRSPAQNRPALQQRLPFVPTQTSAGAVSRAFTPNAALPSSRPSPKYI